MGDEATEFHFALKACEGAFLGFGAFRRQDLEGDQGRFRIVGFGVACEVNGPHAAASEWSENVKRTESQALPGSGKEFACLEVRQMIAGSEPICEVFGGGALVVGAVGEEFVDAVALEESASD